MELSYRRRKSNPGKPSTKIISRGWSSGKNWPVIPLKRPGWFTVVTVDRYALMSLYYPGMKSIPSRL
jgi:hypothetical protein